MTDYYFAEKGEFLINDFNNKIFEAINVLTKNNDSEYKITFKEIRNSREIGYSINGITYSGNYITYEIRKDNAKIAQLNCFLSSKNDYMEVISTKD